MKNLFPIAIGIALTLAACGGTEEEKQVKQTQAEEKVDEKVNEIMNELEAASRKAEMTDDSTSHNNGDHEGHSH